mmetsp:Transcript_5173/g.13858  ORF Transcript_5173/g.13858 Transcript_5173/m.13858 type:complete len:250 (-) Transcript_5173:454-1203(-)
MKSTECVSLSKRTRRQLSPSSHRTAPVFLFLTTGLKSIHGAGELSSMPPKTWNASSLTAADQMSSSDHTMGAAFSGIQCPSSSQDPTIITSSWSVTWILARNTTVAMILPLLEPWLGHTSSTLTGMYTPLGAAALPRPVGVSGCVGTASAADSDSTSSAFGALFGADLRGTMVLAAVPDSSATGASATGVDLGMGYAWTNCRGSASVAAVGAPGAGALNLGSPGVGSGSVWLSSGIHTSTASGRVMTTL